MSYVTSVVIVTGYASEGFEAAVTAPFLFRDGAAHPDSFRQLDMDAAGGSKFPGGDVYAAGLNYCDRERLWNWLCSLPWSSWGVVTVETEGDGGTLWLFGERLSRAAAAARTAGSPAAEETTHE